MSAGIKITYDDAWIEDNWMCYRNWLSLCNAYNEEHGTSISYNTFKSHCNREKKFNFHYTKEQEQWLKDNYPGLGRNKCAEKFNARFGENRTVNAIKVKCIKMGLTVTDTRKKEVSIENTKRFYPVGTVIKKTHGEPYVKTQHGWKRLKEIVYGDRPKGYIIAHLDGDVNNCSSDNLVAIKRAISARMTANNLWSQHPEITRTGILCCTLETVMKESDSQ